MLMKIRNENEDKWVVFDLDGTLADISQRRGLSDLGSGKIDWDSFFEPSNIDLDTPKGDVIHMLRLLWSTGHNIAILSGRSMSAEEQTKEWLRRCEVPYHLLRMRPTTKTFMYMPDDKLKRLWLEELWPGDNKKNIICVFDDRDRVVKMWREMGLTCFQVEEGNF